MLIYNDKVIMNHRRVLVVRQLHICLGQMGIQHGEIDVFERFMFKLLLCNIKLKF